MLKKISFNKAYLIYLVITLVIFFIFTLQRELPGEASFLFLITYLMIFYAVSEVISFGAGIYSVVLTLAVQLGPAVLFPSELNTFFTLSVFYTLLVFYYFLVKTLRAKKLEKTRERERHFRSLINYSLQPLLLKNERGEVLFASDSIRGLLGLKKDLQTGKTIENLLHPEDVNSHKRFLKEVGKSPFEKKVVEVRMKKENAGWIWVRQEGINLLDHDDIRAVVTSLQDITFQKELDKEKGEIIMQEKNARSIAEKAVKDRDEFLSIASHELRTPLTTILLQLQATLRKIMTQSLADFTGRDLLNSLQIAEKQSQNLATLIKDLLNVSLASTGRLTLNKERVNLSSLTQNVITKYDEEIKLSGCTVRLRILDSEIVGNWDPVRIEQAIINLFMNALKYAKGERITITVKKDKKWGVFEVEDKGKGIPLEIQQEIFEPFKRPNNSVKGLGVGLFIVKQIAKSHGGEVNLISEPGKGATFILRLPLSTKRV